MDKKVDDDLGFVELTHENDVFLLNEGLEVLANYRSIEHDATRLAVRQLIASLAVDNIAR